MVEYGLTRSGFVPKPIDVVRSEIVALWRTAFGQNVKVDPESPDGQIIDIFSEREADIWDQSERVYSACYVDGASGASLDDLVSQSAITREAATKSTVTLTLSGTPATFVPSGSIVSESISGNRWLTTAGATIGGGGTITVAAEAENTGPIPGIEGTIDTIVTPVAGWSGVTNDQGDAELGQDTETDSALRTRFKATFRGGGGSSDEAIRALVLRVDGVTQCVVISNRSDTTDAAGRPPHSFEVVVAGGANQDIIDTIWFAQPAGILSHGSTTGTATDTQGDPQTVRFSRFTNIRIYITVEYEAADNADANIEDLILDEILSHAATLTGGDDVVPFQFQQAIETEGLLSMNFYVGKTSPAVSEDIIEIDRTEQATFQSADVTFTPLS